MFRPVPKPEPKQRKLCKYPNCKTKATEDYCKMHSPKPIKTKTRKATGEKAMFEMIWETRPHVSQVSGQPLLHRDHPLWYWQFMHLVSKGARPDLRLDPDNIMLATPDEHFQYDNFPYKCTGQGWEKVFSEKGKIMAKNIG